MDNIIFTMYLLFLILYWFSLYWLTDSILFHRDWKHRWKKEVKRLDARLTYMKEFSASASFQINDESIEELEEALESADKEYARQKKKLENKKFMLRCLTFGLLGKGRII